jgi:hypothetical protein
MRVFIGLTLVMIGIVLWSHLIWSAIFIGSGVLLVVMRKNEL